ncbi:calcium-binding protein-like protein [Aphelenchoides avenae]|nr:calcium-binding protein-like protein [Aphelenchus avenae]
MHRTCHSFLRVATVCLFITSSFSLPPVPRRDGQPEEQLAVPQKPAPQDVAAPANRPDHLEAVPLERDGALNKEFRKEILLGEDSELDVKNGDVKRKKVEKTSEDLLREMFKKADTNKDGKLSADELKAQILANTQHHLEQAKTESENRFQEVDENGDGKISWDEYKSHFMVEKNFVDKEHAKEHAQHDENLDANSRVLLDEEKNAFAQADADGDGLDEVEWLGFQHPEHSKLMLKEMAEEIIKAFDKDKDGKLTADEFAHFAPGEVTDSKMEREYVEERRHEFKQIDSNQDGFADLEEMLSYVDPRNERHAIDEVNEILDIADVDKDGFVTLKELLAKAEMLASSGFIRPRERLHDDL